MSNNMYSGECPNLFGSWRDEVIVTYMELRPYRSKSKLLTKSNIISGNSPGCNYDGVVSMLGRARRGLCCYSC